MAINNLQAELQSQLKALLDGGQAHATLDAATSDMPFDLQGKVPACLPYSPWQLLEHIRIAQHEILNFSDNADGSYKPMKWPDDYWPKHPAPPDESAWQHSIDQIQQDRAAFEHLLQTRNLTEPFPWGEGQNLLREAFLIAGHESYHTGELILARRLLGAWTPAQGHA